MTSVWPEVPLKHVADINGESLPEDTDPEFEFAYVDIGSVSQGSIDLPGETTRFAVAPSRARRLAQPGDTIVSTVRTYLRAVARVPDLDTPMVFSTGFAVLRPREDLEPRFLSWCLQSDDFVSQVEAASTGVSYPATTAAAIGEIKVKLPPRSEQRAIADYLDWETAKVDTLVAKLEELIATIRARSESTWARMYHLLTNEYGTTSLRRVIDSVVDGPFGSSLASSHYSDSGARVIRLGNIGVNAFRDSDRAFISMDHFAALVHHSVVPGDVVVAGLGDDRMPLGRAAVVPDVGPALVKADCYRVRPTSAVSNDYLSWALSSPPCREQFGLLSRGSTRSRLNTAVVQEALIPVPPLRAQDAVVRAGRHLATRVDDFAARTARAIALAKERRGVLITAAVVGQSDNGWP